MLPRLMSGNWPGSTFDMPRDAELKRSSGLSLYWLRGRDWELEVDPSNGLIFNVENGQTKLSNTC